MHFIFPVKKHVLTYLLIPYTICTQSSYSILHTTLPHVTYTLYIQVYSIRGNFPNKLSNRLVPLVTHLVIPILMVSDLQTDDVALKSKNAWLVLFVAPCHVYPWTRTSTKIILQLHQVAVYWYKHENHTELWVTCSTTSPLHSFCHSRWRLLDARDC